VSEHVRGLLGPSCIVEGEDAQLYEKLLSEIGLAVKPIDIIDWLLVKDFADLTWEIQRARRLRASLMRMSRQSSMEFFLESIMRQGPPGLNDAHEADRLALEWSKGGKQAIKRVQTLFAQAGFSASDIAAQSLLSYAEQFDRLDQREEHYETRRDSLLKQIERRREGWAREFRRTSENLIEVGCDESPPHALADGTMQDFSKFE
jgi:hypothetical protein